MLKFRGGVTSSHAVSIFGATLTFLYTMDPKLSYINIYLLSSCQTRIFGRVTDSAAALSHPLDGQQTRPPLALEA